MITTIFPKHSFSFDNVRLNVFHANKQEGLPKHQHIYAHGVLCNAGSCLVSLEGRSYVLTKDSEPLLLPEKEWHEIEALEDGTVFINTSAEFVDIDNPIPSTEF